MNSRHTLLIMALLLAAPARAQFGEGDRVLIPTVANTPVPGAFGSQWVTEIAAQNRTSQSVDILPASWSSGGGVIITLPTVHLEPQQTRALTQLPTSPHGVVLFRASGAAFAARVRDLSRALDTWGTSLPVVRENTLGTGPVTLLNVPNGDRFRVALRLYDFSPDGGAPLESNDFEIEVLSLTGTSPLARFTVPAEVLRDADGKSQSIRFAYVNDLRVGRDAGDRLRVTIRTTLQTKMWGFASVTNNETQHVTVIAPE